MKSNDTFFTVMRIFVLVAAIFLYALSVHNRHVVEKLNVEMDQKIKEIEKITDETTKMVDETMKKVEDTKRMCEGKR